VTPGWPRAFGGGVVLDLLLIGLGITLEPFPLTAFILILSAEKGTRKGLAFILGWLACLVAVIAAVVLTTGGHPPKSQTAPSTAVLAVKLALGVVLILLAVRQRRRMGRPRKPPTWMASLDRVSLWSVVGLAAFLQPWALVAAGAATVAQAKLSEVFDSCVKGREHQPDDDVGAQGAVDALHGDGRPGQDAAHDEPRGE
jgi:hypothetical protein